MKSSTSFAIALGWLIAGCALAQHEHHAAPPAPTPTPTSAPAQPGAPTPAPKGTPAPGDSMKPMEMDHAHAARASPTKPEEKPDRGRDLFQSDMSPMTGMTPRDPMAAMAMPGWHFMDIGVVRLSYNRQGGASGGSGIESSNWNMVHAQKELGPGRVSLMLMNSLEPVTFAKLGSRELFQTGESYRGQALVDRQHPHDFFMNLSATYRLDLGADSGAWIQLAPVGEPALGPVAFMHRASSGENPTAPLGHHWQDSTHIAFNVITLGAGWKWIALEGSVFRGEEPDEHRWGIEGGSIDSASGRVRLFFGGGWSGELSHGFLKNPEPIEPGNTHRTTAAISYGAEGDRPFAATLLWGGNDESHGSSEAWLLEAAWQWTARNQVYGRVELVQKDFVLITTKRVLPAPHEGFELVRVAAYTLGYLRDFDLLSGLKMKTGLGADITAYSLPSSLEPVYGSFPVSVHAFVRLRWGSPHGAEHSGHAGMKM